MGACEEMTASPPLFSYVSPEARVPADHPLRAIRALVDGLLREMLGDFDGLYLVTLRAGTAA